MSDDEPRTTDPARTALSGLRDDLERDLARLRSLRPVAEVGDTLDELSADLVEQLARAQSAAVALRLESEAADMTGYEDSKVIALTAYLLRLGTDIQGVN